MYNSIYTELPLKFYFAAGELTCSPYNHWIFIASKSIYYAYAQKLCIVFYILHWETFDTTKFKKDDRNFETLLYGCGL